MRLRELREAIGDAYGTGAVDGSTALLVYVRDAAQPIDSEEAWTASAISAVQVDDDGGDLDLLTQASSPGRALTLTELAVMLSEMPAESDEYSLFVRGKHAAAAPGQDEYLDAPVVGSALDPEQRMLAVIVEFEGYEEVLG